jgi:hypothetical protein
MIEIASVRLIAPDPIYEVLPAHVELLNSRGITFTLLAATRQPESAQGKRRSRAALGTRYQ